MSRKKVTVRSKLSKLPAHLDWGPSDRLVSTLRRLTRVIHIEKEENV